MKYEQAQRWMERIKVVQREYAVASLGIGRLGVDARDDPAILTDDMKVRDIQVAAANLEGTYIVRVFSEFETSLHEYFDAKKMPQPRSTEALVNRVRDKAIIPLSIAGDVHRVREYRNALVHLRTQANVPVEISKVVRALCAFLSYLQRTW